MKNVEFSIGGYFSILTAAEKAGYLLLPLKDAMVSTYPRVMILRHDIDISLDFALEMAELEHKRGKRSTYFILPYNDFYNPLSIGGRAMLKKIKGLGHEIGLHWDSTLYSKDPQDLEKQFKRDLSLLEDIVEEKIVSASQHIPIDSPHLNVEALIEYETYSPKIQSRFTYMSDSSMVWRNKTPLDLVQEGVNIHFLAHPVWWVSEGKTSLEKLAYACQRSQSHVQSVSDAYAAYMTQVVAKLADYDLKFKNRIPEKT